MACQSYTQFIQTPSPVITGLLLFCYNSYRHVNSFLQASALDETGETLKIAEPEILKIAEPEIRSLVLNPERNVNKLF